MSTQSLTRVLWRWICISLASLAITSASAGTLEASEAFVYALTQVELAPNQLYGFRLDEATGTLTLLPGFPISTGGSGSSSLLSETVRYDAAASRLFVINDGSDTLSVYAVNKATGALTPMPYSPIPLGPGIWDCVTVHPSGSPVIVGIPSLPPIHPIRLGPYPHLNDPTTPTSPHHPIP